MLVRAILIVKNPGAESWEGLGTHEFGVLPRVGECIGLDVNGWGYLYEVVAIHHPGERAANWTDAEGYGVDIYAVRLGLVEDMVRRLFEESSVAE